MQRAFVTIVLALALTSAVATYTTSNYAKATVKVLEDTDSNFTNQSISTGLSLTSVSSGDLYVYGVNKSVNTNISAISWNLWMKKLDAKTFTSSSNNSYSVTVGNNLYFSNGYAVGLTYLNDTNVNIPQVYVIQQQLSGGAALPRVPVTTNKNGSFGFDYTATLVGKNVYIIYEAASGRLNGTSFAVGGAVSATEFQVSTSGFTGELAVAWGEAISSSQVFASWQEGDALKDAVVDFSKSAVTVSTVGGYNKTTYVCIPYVTDKKDYGEVCIEPKSANNTDSYVYHTRANTTTNLVTYATYNQNTSGYAGLYPYGPYVIMAFSDTISNTGSTTYSYEIWNLETGANFKNRTQYLVINDTSKHVDFRVTSGGLYTLLWDQANNTAPRTNIQVGMLLGGSYLTSVLGFVLTIIAGLLLF